MTLRIHIDQIVLEGLDYSPREIAQLKRTLSRELTQSMSAGGVSQELLNGGAVDSVSAPSVTLPQKPTPTQSGHAIARALHGGISK
jgi:hypothetical protein